MEYASEDSHFFDVEIKLNETGIDTWVLRKAMTYKPFVPLLTHTFHSNGNQVKLCVCLPGLGIYLSNILFLPN